jgi:phosphocarrier protein HPr
MKTKIIKLKIKNKLGIHARPASVFVRLASTFNADISVEKNSENVNGKSLIGMLMLAAGHNSNIKITATGKDCSEAIAALENLVNNNLEFNEE